MGASASPRRRLHAIALAAGAIGLVWLLGHTGLGPLWVQAKALGAGAIVFVLLAGVEHGLHAEGWGRCIAPGHAPGFGRLFEAYLAGYSFSLLTPTAALGGDVLRASLLPRSIPATEAAASVTADRLACSVADAGLGALGVAILLGSGLLEPWHRAGLVAATMLFAVGIGGFFLVQRSGRLAGAIGRHPLVARAGGARLAERLVRASADLDFRLRSLHLERPAAFRSSLAWNLAASCVGGVQVAVLLAFTGSEAVWWPATQIFLVGSALDLFAFFIPARLGVQEGARVLGASVAGIDPAVGLLLGLVLRVEQVLWAAVGLGLQSRLARRSGGAA